MADTLRPAVTVVDHPGHQVGRVAARRLLARLADTGLQVERIRVPARIIERGSGELRPRWPALATGSMTRAPTSSSASISAPPRPRPSSGRLSDRGAGNPAAQDARIDGAQYAERPTPWRTRARGQTEIDPHRLTRLAVDLIGAAVRSAEHHHGPVRVRAIGVTGLAESGVLLDAAARPVAPAIAWFDHRGGRELEHLAQRAPAFRAAFERTTGLPWSSQASLAKLLWLQASGHRAGPGATWLSVPEWIVFALGGTRSASRRWPPAPA